MNGGSDARDSHSEPGCDEIPAVAGMAYLVSDVWKINATEMPKGVYDTEVVQDGDCQISVNGTAAKFTFVGH